MMSLTTGRLTLPGALPEDPNPQPFFRDKDPDTRLFHDDTLTDAEAAGLGKACGARILPYRMQDRYARRETPVTLKTIELENDFLKAVFLPSCGGKLRSLYDKEGKRELLFVNPVFRPANLANRNAWTSGGIEWNLGHTGHWAFTCDDLFAAAVTAPDGETFLRFYEYEATHAQVIQLDFHLPEGAKQLGLHVRIENARDQESPLYYWTNTAVVLTPDTRVFSGTPDILYQLTPNSADPIPGFGRCRMPVQPNLDCADISYPWRIPHSVEYFFQNPPEMVSPWEVSIEADCRGILERSTQPLFSRKMFCWGNSIGGRHWCDYLSEEGRGNYIEIQAGLAPTQNHTSVIGADGRVCFSQFFCAFTAPSCAQTQEWNEALPAVSRAVEETLDANAVEALHRAYEQKALLPAGRLLHGGSVYGMLENVRRKAENRPQLTPWLSFGPEGLSADNMRALQAWQGLLEGRPLPEGPVPLPYMTDLRWEKYLARCAAKSRETAFQYAVLLVENGREAEGETLLQSLSASGAPFASYALGSLAKGRGDFGQAARLYLLACDQAGPDGDCSFPEAAMAALLQTDAFEAAWKLYQEIPAEKRTETERLLACAAALPLEQWDFLEAAFTHEFASIREGSVGLADIWLEYRARLLAREENRPFDPEKIDRTLPLPRQLNFRMFD